MKTYIEDIGENAKLLWILDEKIGEGDSQSSHFVSSRRGISFAYV
jgi:hypothetical protein